ncbi:MAG: radical SAM protein, partial [Myxococcota bacterium]|nr:radical SAM protein [Myxococcota bacterium]
MRVVLVNPPGPSGRGYIREGRCEQRLSSFAYRMMPISLPSTAALLRARGHSVWMIDASVEAVDAEGLRERIRALAPGLLVFAVSTPTYEGDLRVMEVVADGTSAHRTAIGLHVTALPAETLRESRLDSVVRGEPERTVAELADVLAGGGDLEAVAGLSFRRNAETVHNADRPFIDDLDALPTPARELLDERRYVLPLPDRPYALVVPSRGCPHRCTFCGAHLYYGRRLRLRQPARVVDEIQEILERGTIRDVVMWSDSFTLDREFVLEICREIDRRRIPLRWMCNSRVDAFDEELARLMRQSGCDGVSFGIESGDQRMLDRMHKGTTVEQGRRAVAAARRAGIPVLAHFVLGIPGETLETIRRTVAHACELDPDYAQFYCATPQPGTVLWEEATRKGYLTSADWSRFELNRAVLSTEHLSAADLERARRRAYLDFYLRMPVLRRLVSRVTLRTLPGTAAHAATFAG